ncbi:MAG: ACT domain-containing protein [Actinomycetia bacterium]|nr:ACT domain-containing protein [Actinomycetes bacterium]
MSFLLRIELPDVPGSLGAVAAALGQAGADITAIEVVEHRDDGRVVDDVLLELPPPDLPDKLVSACQSVDSVRVHWVSRYAAGANLRMDLEAVEAMTERPRSAIERLAQSLPETFRADWGVAVERTDGVVHVVAATSAAPAYVEAMRDWFDIGAASALPHVEDWRSTVLAGAPIPGHDVVVVLGRHGGPEVLASELARLGHLAGLAATISSGSERSGGTS